MNYWIAVCSSHGTVKVAQKSKPTSCKEEIRTGARSVRRCGNELTDHQDVTAKVEAAKAAQPAACARRGLSNWCTDKDVKLVQLRSQCAGGGKSNEYLGDVVHMCAECRKSNNGGFKILKGASGKP